MTVDRREYQRIYYQENREAVRKRQNEKRWSTPPVPRTEEQRQKNIERCRADRIKNRDKRNEGQRRYTEKNREKVYAANRQYALDHPEKMKEGLERWRSNNPDRWQEQRRTHSQIRRARKNETSFEKFDPLEVFERDEWMCGICESPIDSQLKWPDQLSVSLDHIVPLSKGGTHTQENCQAAHLGCNIKKGSKIPMTEKES
jgi:hypothetical protein